MVSQRPAKASNVFVVRVRLAVAPPIKADAYPLVILRTREVGMFENWTLNFYLKI